MDSLSRPFDRIDPGSLTLRSAAVADAPAIARLFLIASDGLAAYIWQRVATPGQSLEDAGAARYARTGVAFSFENCLVVERNGEVVAMAHAFPMDAPSPGAEAETDPVLRPYAELEDYGSFYLAGLAVDEPMRGWGIGTRLLNAVISRARGRGLRRVSLICFDGNRDAMRLYTRRGFHEMDRRSIVPHPCLHYTDGDAILLAKVV
ncbi:MAG: GNAT family N-acetyltransferase [Alphaproteobacteria bacterium]|nr:GNAT family N-acetyltransferase [Alphaproteobacteria bacterium]